MRLIGGLLGFEGFVDFHELFLALTQQFLFRVFTPDVDELEVVTETFSHSLEPLYSSFKLHASSCKKSIQFNSQGGTLAA
ncbi:hypothetical protein ALP29_201886 [Pseudomonas syringae pv. avii]|uniref:Uncharacterized protein n=1 Tax=Pseudomonas syringae pv. avii TaxID=663959 RepID=A0A3M5VIC6_PSESX|nr:hypothetical protein ALP29_201886 [Pseudomonas syringae pv. avii]